MAIILDTVNHSRFSIRNVPGDGSVSVITCKEGQKEGQTRLPTASAGFLLGLLSDTEDGGDIFLRNVEFSELHGVTTQKTVTVVTKYLRMSSFSLTLQAREIS
jgi:hypothetical protein